MEEHIVHLLGGRMAEKLVLNDISTGAQNDLQRVSDIARAMVTKYGMSDVIGPMALGNGDEEVFLGRDFASKRNYSEKVASEVDHEIKRIVDEGYETAKDLLTNNMDKLHAIANALLKLETLDADLYKNIFDGKIIVGEEDTIEDVENKVKALKAEEEENKTEENPETEGENENQEDK